jgi:hypothetical protein
MLGQLVRNVVARVPPWREREEEASVLDLEPIETECALISDDGDQRCKAS